MFACSLPLVLRECCLFQRQRGMANAMSRASTDAVCSHPDDAVGSVMPCRVGFFPVRASVSPGSFREGEDKPRQHILSLYGNLTGLAF